MSKSQANDEGPDRNKVLVPAPPDPRIWLIAQAQWYRSCPWPPSALV